MKVRLVSMGMLGEIVLPLPDDVLELMNLKDGDDVVLDISHSGSELIIYKAGTEPSRGLSGVKEVVR